jgi:hypothetical protein
MLNLPGRTNPGQILKRYGYGPLARLTRADRIPNSGREKRKGGTCDGFDVACEVLHVEDRHFVGDPAAGRRHIPADLLARLCPRIEQSPEDATKECARLWHPNSSNYRNNNEFLALCFCVNDLILLINKTLSDQGNCKVTMPSCCVF